MSQARLWTFEQLLELLPRLHIRLVGDKYLGEQVEDIPFVVMRTTSSFNDMSAS
jgi:hypothetical protein